MQLPKIKVEEVLNLRNVCENVVAPNAIRQFGKNIKEFWNCAGISLIILRKPA
jgi:hypothetical protein